MRRSRLERTLRGRQRRGACRTGKVRYADAQAAKDAARAIKTKLTSAGMEIEYQRAYRCEFCADYHLTTHPEESPCQAT